MSTINSRLDRIEKTVEAHLIESGEIRSDLKWLKRAFWTLAGAGLTFATIITGYAFNFILRK